MKIFTKEMLVNSAITFVVVVGALYTYNKFLAPKAAPAVSEGDEA